MKMMKKLIALSLLSLSVCAFADLKVGIVNMPQAFANVPQGQMTADQLGKTFMAQQNKLNKEKSALETAISNFNRNAPTLSAADKASQEQTLAAQQQQFEQDGQAFDQAVQTARQNAATAYQTAFVQAVSQVAQSGDYDFIMTNETIPYYKDAFDVTSQVIKIMTAAAQSK